MKSFVWLFRRIVIEKKQSITKLFSEIILSKLLLLFSLIIFSLPYGEAASKLSNYRWIQCVDINCGEIIAEGVTTAVYPSPEKLFLSFRSNVPVKIIGKTVDKNFFLVKIGSRKGFVPAKFVKETKIHHADSKLADIKFNFDLWEENLRLQSLKTEHVEAIEKSNETSISSSADSVLDDAQSSVATPFVYSPKQTVIDGTTIDEDLLQTITPSSNFIETPVSKTVTIEAHFTGTELNKETVSHNVDELFDKNASLPDLQKQADAAAVDEIKQELKIDDKSDLTENHQLRFVESNKSNKLDQIDENSPSDIPIEEEFSDPQSHLPIDEQAESEKIFDPSDIDDILNDTYENSISNHSEYSISDDDNDAEQHDNSTDNFSDKTLKIDENHNNEPKIQASANESSSLESLVEKPKVKQTEIPVVLDERPDQTNSPVVESDSIDEKIKSESIANEKSIDNERTDGINQTVLDSNQFHHPHIDVENFDHTSPENSTIESSPKRKDELGNKDVPTSAPEMILSKKLDPSNSHKSDDSFGQHSHNFHQSNLNDNLIVEQISSQQEHQHHSHASRHHHQQHHSFVSEPSQSTSSHPADLQHHHPISVERLIIETSDLKHKKIVPPIQQDHLINIDPGQAQKFLKADVHSLNHPSRSTEFNAASFSQESSDSSETISLQSRASSSAQALDYPNEYRANVLNDFVPNTDADQINVERINISAKKKLLAEKIGFVTVIMEIIPDEVELFFESFNVSLHVIICTSLVAFFWCLMKIFIFLINSNKKVRELREIVCQTQRKLFYFEAEKQKIDAQYKTFRQESLNHRDNTNHLERQKYQLEEENEKLKNELLAVKKENRTLLSLVESNPKISSRLDSVSKELDESKKLNDELQSKMKDLENEIDTYQCQIENLKNFSESDKEEISHLNDQLQQSKEEISKLNEMMEKSEQQFNMMEMENTNLKEQQNKLSEEIKEMKDDLLSAEAKLKIMTASNQSLEEEVEELRKKSISLQNEIETKSIEMNSMQTLLTKLNKTVPKRSPIINGDADSIDEEGITLHLAEKNDDDDDSGLSDDPVFLQDVLQLKIRLTQLEIERDQNKDRYEMALKQINEMTDEIEVAKQSLKEAKEECEKAVNEKTKAIIELEVLGKYYKEKEIEYAKHIGINTIKQEQQNEDVETLTSKLEVTEESNLMLKNQLKSVKKELDETERRYKSQLNMLEKQSHENWIAVRAAERKLEETKAEALALRQTLSQSINSPPPSDLSFGRLDDSRSSISSIPELLNNSLQVPPPPPPPPFPFPSLFPLPIPSPQNSQPQAIVDPSAANSNASFTFDSGRNMPAVVSNEPQTIRDTNNYQPLGTNYSQINPTQPTDYNSAVQMTTSYSMPQIDERLKISVPLNQQHQSVNPFSMNSNYSNNFQPQQYHQTLNQYGQPYTDVYGNSNQSYQQQTEKQMYWDVSHQQNSVINTNNFTNPNANGNPVLEPSSLSRPQSIHNQIV